MGEAPAMRRRRLRVTLGGMAGRQPGTFWVALLVEGDDAGIAGGAALLLCPAELCDLCSWMGTRVGVWGRNFGTVRPSTISVQRQELTQGQGQGSGMVDMPDTEARSFRVTLSRTGTTTSAPIQQSDMTSSEYSLRPGTKAPNLMSTVCRLLSSGWAASCATSRRGVQTCCCWHLACKGNRLTQSTQHKAPCRSVRCSERQRQGRRASHIVNAASDRRGATFTQQCARAPEVCCQLRLAAAWLRA